ncbi:MAG: Cna B-type domain-containing protein, partial [Bacilli bacterium]|nr:Cna B-type domain-containing protein [Bacilli bacterium]
MRLLDKNRSVISDWGNATRNGTTYTRVFDVVAEIRRPEDVIVQVRDASGNEADEGRIKVQYIDAKAPELISSKVTGDEWSKNKVVTYTAQDKGIGQVMMSFNNLNEYIGGSKSGDNYSVTYNFVGDVYGEITVPLHIKDGLGNVKTQRVTIKKLDGTAPTIENEPTKQLIENNKKTRITVTAHDRCEALNGEIGSGVTGYAITRENTAPSLSKFVPNGEFTVDQNGTYYLWARDLVGNISAPKVVKVTQIEIDIAGTITWNDQNNRYASRKATTLNLKRKIGNGAEEQVASINLTAGQASYKFQARQVNDAGQTYTYRVEQAKVDGYETLYNGYNITNNLILPNYNGEVTYAPINTYENMYLKNGQVKVRGKVQASTSNRDKVGLCGGQVTFNIDSGITLDTNTLVVKFHEASTGSTTVLTNYTKNGNTITVPYGKDANGVSQKGDYITIEVQGM